jgi:hypothetical protein
MDTQNQSSNVNYVLDGYVAGYDTSFFKTITGTDPVASAGLVPFNGNLCSSRSSFKYGDFEFSLKIPAAPTAGDNRVWGLQSVGMGLRGAIIFLIQADVFSVKVHDNGGTELFAKVIDWDDDWTNAETSFRIRWERDVVEFLVGGTRVAAFRIDPTIQHTISTYPLSILITNLNSDDMSLRYLALRGVKFAQNPTGLGNVSLSTGDIEIGAVELKDASSDTRAYIGAANAAKTSATNILAVQNLDANGKPISGGSSTSTGYIGKPSGTNADFTTAYASGTTILCSGLPFGSLTDKDIVRILQISSTGVVTAYDRTASTITVSGLTITVVGATFSVTDSFVVETNVYKPIPSYDSGSQSELVNPIWSVSDQYLAETLVDTTNVAAATTYYPSASGLSMDGYRNLSLEGLISGGVTTTIEVTNDDAASPDWLDITDSLYNWITGGTRYATSWVDTNFLFQMDNVNFKNIRIKSVTSDATNAVQYNLRRTY